MKKAAVGIKLSIVLDLAQLQVGMQIVLCCLVAWEMEEENEQGLLLECCNNLICIFLVSYVKFGIVLLCVRFKNV